MLQFEDVLLRQGQFTMRANWQLEAGARCAILGPSGAGKSTLLAALAGFLPPARGRILWQGRDLGPLSPGARPVSILFQDNNLFPHMDLRRNLGLALHPGLRLSRGQWSQVEAALQQVGLSGMGARRPGSLSGGQQGRAALARALLRDRPILALDEPFSALGPGLRDEMLALVRRLAADRGLTVLMVTHDPADARRLGGVTVFVDEGQAQPPQDTTALFAAPNEALRRYLGPERAPSAPAR